VADDSINVFVDAQGRISVAGRAAQRRLAGRPGRYRLVPSSDNLVILERVEAPPGAPTRPRGVTIAGDIDRIGGLVEVFNLISGCAWSGSLGVLAGLTRKTIYFKRGDITTAASNIAEDRIGAILYRHGMITAQYLEQALAAVTQEQRVGQILVDKGHLTVHQLYQYVRKQIEEIFFSVLAIRDGEYYFQRTDDDDGPPSQLLLPTRELLFDGVRRIDELAYFREQLPGPHVVLVRRWVPRDDTLPPRAAAVLELVDGKRDLAAIARESHLGEFEATKVMYQLMQEGRVEVGPHPRTRTPVPAPPTGAPGDTLDAYNLIYARIQALVASHGRPDLMSRGLRSFFLAVDEFAPLFAGVTLLSDGRLPREQVLANLAIAPVSDRADYLQRGLNELLFFVLFTAGESVDRTREAELQQRLNQLLREVVGDGVPGSNPGAQRT
jgi:uncharacterized protein DUF4388